MKLLKNVNDINAFMEAIKHCHGDVLLKSADGTETFNLKSALSEYIAIGRLADTHGDEWEIYCLEKSDEHYLLKFFYEISK